ncbi:hypothetical protein ACET61_20420, partial [Aeromonas veronii]
QLTTDELCLSGPWQPHYRYREMKLRSSSGSDCQLQRGICSSVVPGNHIIGIVKWNSAYPAMAIVS